MSPLTLDELSAKAAALDLPPDGFRLVTVAPDSGYGAFSLALPVAWVDWILTQDTVAISAVALRQDSAWGERFRVSLEGDNRVATDGSAVNRAASANPNSRELMVVTVTLSDASELRPAELEGTLLETHRAAGGQIVRSSSSPLEGGLLVELTVLFDNAAIGWLEPVVEQKSFILDDANGWLWGVTCNVHQSIASGFVEECGVIQRSFIPYGPITP